MQPVFLSFASGVPYRKTVKPYFRRIAPFYLLVSICENMPFRQFLSFLTAGNKSKCGTLHCLTHPRQSTVESILRPVSPQNRQASQRKTFALSSASAQTSSHLRRHRTSVLSTPQKLPGTLIRTTSTPNLHPRRPPATPQTLPQPHPRRTPSHTHSHAHSHTPDARLPHTHNPSPPQIRMQFPNRSDSATRSDTNQQHTQGELHAKLLGGTRVAPPGGHRGAWPGIKPTISTPGPTGVEGAGGSGGHGRASRRGAERSEVLASRAAGPYGARNTSGTTSPARSEAATGPAGPGRGAGGRRQGPCRPRPIGGRRVACGAWPGIKPTISTPGPTGVEGAGGAGGHGRASRRGAERSEAA